MRPLRSVAIYFAFVFVGGALLAPWIFWIAQMVGLHQLTQYPFHKFVTRSIELLALVGLWPFLRSLQIRSWREVGFCPPKTEWRKLAMGLALGFCSLAVVALITIAAGIRTPEVHYSLAKKILKAGGAAVVVAVLEELLFRGVMFGALRKVHGWIAALILSSGFYALVHFFADKVPQPETVTCLSGFVTLGQLLGGFAEFERFVPGFFSLFVAGALLALAYQRTGSLYFSIGLHAGWIFWLKSYGFLTKASVKGESWFWGTSKLINGWLAFLVLMVLLGIFLRWPGLFGRKKKLPDETR